MHRSDAHGPSPDRGSLVDGDPHGLPVGGGLERTIGVDGPGEVIVGQRDRRADEDAVGQAGRFVHKGVVLHLAAVPHDDALADVGASAHDAVPSEEACSRTWARCQMLVPSPRTASSETSADGAIRLATATPVRAASGRPDVRVRPVNLAAAGAVPLQSPRRRALHDLHHPRGLMRARRRLDTTRTRPTPPVTTDSAPARGRTLRHRVRECGGDYLQRDASRSA